MSLGMTTNLSLGPAFLHRILLEVLAVSSTYFAMCLWHHKLKPYEGSFMISCMYLLIQGMKFHFIH